jgi:LDH2 family malate/lactate/ureidoglycolate dehydrogenase
MRIKINEAEKLAVAFLERLGFSGEEPKLITENLLESELAGKKTHGFIYFLILKKQANEGKLNTDKLKINIIRETPVSLYIDGNHKLGYGIVYKSLDLAFEKARVSKIVSVSIKNLGLTGYVGAYARKATENNFIFLGFNSSPAALVPYGSKKNLWGANPLTIGIPADDIPVILDMASSRVTRGNLMLAKMAGKQIRPNVAIDANGQLTTDPAKAMAGGLLPFGGHKGSGLGFIVELLAGILGGSRANSVFSNDGGGCFYILIDPTLFRPLGDFKKDVKVAIEELKNSPKMDGFKEIYFPGEQSHKLREKQISENSVEINDDIINRLMVGE